MQIPLPLSLIAAFVLPLALGLASPAAADTLPRPKIDFSADGDLKTDQLRIGSRVFYSPGKERREHRLKDTVQVIIVRHDKKLVWVLLPEQKLYMEVDMAQSQPAVGALPADAKIDRVKIGDEVVNGVPTTKYKVLISQTNGAKLKGLMWVSHDDIIMRMNANATGKGSKMDLSMELKNVKKTKQDASLFEIPEGYHQIPTALPGMETPKELKTN